MNKEPVVISEAAKAVLIAAIAALDKFGIWNVSSDQREALIGLYVALSLLVALLVRRQVTPVQ